MTNLDDELAQQYLADSHERLAAIETDLFAIEQGGAQIDEKLVNRLFRAMQSIKGGAALFDLVKVRDLAHQAENALAQIHNHKLVPTPDRVGILLRATDRLNDLIQNPDASNYADIAETMAGLAGLGADRASAGEC